MGFWLSSIKLLSVTSSKVVYLCFLSSILIEGKKEYEGDDDDMDGFESDEEDEDLSDREMGDEEEGDEAESLKLQKLAAQVCSSCICLPLLIPDFLKKKKELLSF